MKIRNQLCPQCGECFDIHQREISRYSKECNCIPCLCCFCRPNKKAAANKSVKAAYSNFINKQN